MSNQHCAYRPCSYGSHALEPIMETESAMESHVVRWCSNCGAVVIDVDYDGRTAPGRVMAMQLPRIAKARTL